MKTPTRYYSVLLLACFGGGLLAAFLAGYLLLRLSPGRVLRLPALQRENWRQVVAIKQRELSTATWKDPRPLHLLVGDSHVEMGNWYELFGGAYAVRNCGLSRAAIEDVTALVQRIPDQNPATVTVFCGFNNIGRKDPVEICLNHYEKLLVAIRASIKPQKIIALSVTPLRRFPVPKNSLKINEEVSAFNRRLQELCRLQNVLYLDLTTELTDLQGGLSEEFTDDGLHFNQEGYQKIAEILRPLLTTEILRP